MKTRSIFWTCTLIAAITLTSCAPASTNSPVYPTDASIPATVVPTALIAPDATAVEAIQAVATSRGPNLEATDPSTVNLASGQLQLVEFFRFT